MSASEQMDARGEQHNTTFHATRACVRAHLGIGCGPVFRDVEHPRDPSGDQCELW